MFNCFRNCWEGFLPSSLRLAGSVSLCFHLCSDVLPLPQCLCVSASSSWRRGLYLAVAIHFHSASFQLVTDEWGIFIPQLFSHFRSFLSLFPPSFQQTFNLLCAASFVTDTSGSRPSVEREARRRHMRLSAAVLVPALSSPFVFWQSDRFSAFCCQLDTDVTGGLSCDGFTRPIGRQEVWLTGHVAIICWNLSQNPHVPRDGNPPQRARPNRKLQSSRHGQRIFKSRSKQ